MPDPQRLFSRFPGAFNRESAVENSVFNPDIINALTPSDCLSILTEDRE
jgi:hypothetical protein